MAVVDAKGGLKNPRFKVLKSDVSSQIELHRPFGGVVPGLAKREHIKNLPLIEEGLGIEWGKIDAIAVTVGPGLEPALWTGIEYAKKLAKEHRKPLLGANHLEGHLMSPLLSLKEKDKNIALPAIGLVVSGGHTILLALEKIDKWKKIGETCDDAVGEAFDKVGRLLGLPYPGGPEIQREAEKGNACIELPKPMLDRKNYDFSFSGLKTAVMYYLKGKKVTPKLRADMSASFQNTAIEILTTKTMRAVWQYMAKSVILAGGVASNKPLREEMKRVVKKEGLDLYVSELRYSTDNAGMIAVAAYLNHESTRGRSASGGKGKKYRITAQANLNL